MKKTANFLLSIVLTFELLPVKQNWTQPDALLLLIEPQIDGEPPHDEDAEDSEEYCGDDVNPNEVVVALKVRDGRVGKVGRGSPIRLLFSLQRPLE